MISNIETAFEFAQKMDNADTLKDFRKRFYITDENTIYLDGNPLGRLPHQTKLLTEDVVEKQWGTNLIESWNKNWYFKSEELGDKIAQIIGASKSEVIITDSTSVNLYKLVKAALKFQNPQTQIVSDVNFPTDLYIIQGIIQESSIKYELQLVKAENEITIDLDDLKMKITENTALVVLYMDAFKSLFLYDADKITKWAHEKGAFVLWDLSHAVGTIPVELNKTGANLAVGCTYKYLNRGQGSPAHLYVKKDLQEKITSPIQGWFGDNNPFEFDLNYRPVKGIKKFLAGTPPVISQMAIEPGIDLTIEAGIANIHKKSMLQTDYFIQLSLKKPVKFGFEISSPLDARHRGSHVSLKHPDSFRICQALIQPKNGNIKIIPDFREPDNIRFGFTLLYTSFSEIWQTVERIECLLEMKEFELFSSIRNMIT